MKYRNTSGQRLYVRKAGIHVDPGETFESAVPLDNNNAFTLIVKDEKGKGVGTPMKDHEDAV